MAKQTITKTKRRVKKTGSGFKRCQNCGGDGKVAIRPGKFR